MCNFMFFSFCNLLTHLDKVAHSPAIHHVTLHITDSALLHLYIYFFVYYSYTHVCTNVSIQYMVQKQIDPAMYFISGSYNTSLHVLQQWSRYASTIWMYKTYWSYRNIYRLCRRGIVILYMVFFLSDTLLHSFFISHIM